MMCSNIPYIRVVDLITTDEDKKFAPVGRMAAAIIAIMKEKGACLPLDLNASGFMADEVVQHWHMAHSLAIVEMKLMSVNPQDIESFLGGK